MVQLSKLPNIGKVLEEKLNVVGVTRSTQLIEMGSEMVFIKLKTIYPDACINMLQALDAAVQGVKKKELSLSRKEELNQFFKNLDLK